jgi:protein TonB
VTGVLSSAVSFLGSVLFHAAVFAVMGVFAVEEEVVANQEVEMEIIEQPPPPEPEPEPEAVAPEPEPEPEPVKPPPTPKAPAPPKEPEAEPPPPPPSAPPPAADETIADFSGTTLVGEGPGGWASAVGSGAPMNNPIGRAGAQVTGRDRPGVKEGGVIGGTGTKVVPLADLSRQPKQPSQGMLDEALKRSYPKLAKQQGIEGIARIRIRVLASGQVQPLATLSETYPGFADACRASLKELRFEPGLDKVGQPVATDVPYRCEFSVE